MSSDGSLRPGEEFIPAAEQKLDEYMARREQDKVRLSRANNLPIHCTGLIPSRNGLCPCGSGRKYKVCCRARKAYV